MTIKKAYRLTTMQGLGDNIYQRPFIKKLSEDALFFLDTSWPEIYEDLPNVYFDPCKTHLRTQAKNILNNNLCGRSSKSPDAVRLSRRVALKNFGKIRYKNKGIMNGFREHFQVIEPRMDLPSFEPTERIKEIKKNKYAVIKQITFRTEWPATARNPEPEYLKEALNILKSEGFTTVSIADVDGGNEFIIGETLKCDFNFNKGELKIKELLSLVQNAALVVGGIGWTLPACIAYKTKAVFICGGWGEYNHPNKILPNCETPNISFIMPDNFCLCSSGDHNCDKQITDFNNKFTNILKGFYE